MPKQALFIFFLSAWLAGCAEFYGSQPPAPVFGGRPIDRPPNIPSTESPDGMGRQPDENVTTEPLKESPPSQPESIIFKPEPLPPEVEPSEPANEEVPAEPKPAPTTKAQEAAVLQEPAPSMLTPFEPMESSAPLSPAVGALVLAAKQNTSSGNLESASATIERAIRIEPRNANLYYKLAVIRIKQSKPRLAEDLAKKSALLAANDRNLKKHSWLLIAHARELQKNFKGAKEARAKANRL